VIRRFFTCSLLALLSVPALAGDGPAPRVPPLADFEVSYFEVVKPTFGVNPSLGRAWVEIVVILDAKTDDTSVSRKQRIQVPGLSYDKATKSVRLARGGSVVDCGVIRPWGDGGDTRGGCRIEVDREAREIDDGFEVSRRLFAVVTIEVPG